MGNDKRYGFGREYFDKPHNSNYNFERLKYDRTDINKLPDESADFHLKKVQKYKEMRSLT